MPQRVTSHWWSGREDEPLTPADLGALCPAETQHLEPRAVWPTATVCAEGQPADAVGRGRVCVVGAADRDEEAWGDWPVPSAGCGSDTGLYMR